MDTLRWKRLEALFNAALDCDPEERDAFLDEACADDKALRDELASMLSANEESMALALEKPAPHGSYPQAIANIQLNWQAHRPLPPGKNSLARAGWAKCTWRSATTTSTNKR